MPAGLFAHHHVYIEPGNFSFERSIDFVLAVILGGSTVAPGALVGAVTLVILPEYLALSAEWRFAAFGALLVGMLVVRRQGLLDRARSAFSCCLHGRHERDDGKPPLLRPDRVSKLFGGIHA